MPEKYTRKPNSNCKVCKNRIYRRPGILKQNNGRVFCSMNCYGISCRKEIPCAHCGTNMLSGLNKKTCSRACANKHREGMKYKIGRPKDKVSSLKALRKRLVASRGAMCEKCGFNISAILQVHHKDRNRNNNQLINLMLLCPNCHASEHYLK